MSHFNSEDIFDRQAYGQNLADIARSLDSFNPEGQLIANGNRLRTTSAENLLATRFAYDEQPKLFQVVENVNGTLTYLPNEDGVKLSIGTAAGDKIVHSSNEFFHYQSYRETQFGRGVVTPEFQQGVRFRCGAFYEDNSFYWERDEDGTNNMVRRSSASGSVVEEIIPQSEWNVNTFLEGDNHIKNPSGIVLDFDKGQMWKGGLLWYGQGYIYMGFQIGLKIYFAHIFQGANVRTQPIIGEPTLPLRLELENISSVSTPPELTTWGASAAVETGQFEDVGFIHGVSNRTDAITTNGSGGAYVRVLTIRPKATFKGKTNRAKIETLNAGLFPALESHSFMVVRDMPITNSPTWQDVGDESAVEYAVDAQGVDIDAGTVRVEDYVNADNKGGSSRDINADTRNPLVINADGTLGDINLTIIAKATDNQSGSVYGDFRWLEII